MTNSFTPIEILRPNVVEFGCGTIAPAARFAMRIGARRPLVISDPFNAQRVDHLALPGAVKLFGDVKPEPDLPNLDKAVAMAEQALKQAQDEPVVLYNVACFYVGLGDTERAIDLLEKAVNLGWGDRAWMEHDSDLDPLHEHPRFTALLSRIA